jgi:hypothetical protein
MELIIGLPSSSIFIGGSTDSGYCALHYHFTEEKDRHQL